MTESISQQVMSSILRDGGYKGPKLSKSNFTVWKFCMENHLKAKDMWTFIKSWTTVDAKTKRAKCFTTIVSSLCEDQIMTVIETSTPNEAWEALAKVHRASTAANMVFLKQDLRNRIFDGKGNMDDYLSDMKELSLRLKACGETVDEHDLCTTILIGIKPNNYATTIGMLTIGRTEKLNFNDTRSALLLTESTLKRNGRRHENGFRVDASSNKISQESKGRQQRKKTRKCFNCNVIGHLSAQCRKPKRQY